MFITQTTQKKIVIKNALQQGQQPSVFDKQEVVLINIILTKTPHEASV